MEEATCTHKRSPNKSNLLHLSMHQSIGQTLIIHTLLQDKVPNPKVRMLFQRLLTHGIVMYFLHHLMEEITCTHKTRKTQSQPLWCKSQSHQISMRETWKEKCSNSIPVWMLFLYSKTHGLAQNFHMPPMEEITCTERSIKIHI